MPREITVKSILNKAKQRDAWFLDDYRINLYSSCSFNCLYCYIRGSKYGTNLETSLSVKSNALELLEKQLSVRAKKGQYGFIVMSSATDPYLHLERKLEHTREALKIIARYRFPVHMITKSPLIERDFDLLHQIKETAYVPFDLQKKLKGVIISFSFSNVDDRIGEIFEPRAPKPSVRLKALRETLASGFHSGVSLMPLLPFISDTKEHLELLFSNFRSVGAKYVMPSTITLFGNEKADSKTLVMNAIRKHYPQLEKRYTSYFATSNGLPSYYQEAFRRKMKELSNAYRLPLRIVDTDQM